MLLLAPDVFAFEANTPVTPGASAEARALMNFFADIYKKNILAGQHDGWRMTNGLSEELNYITNTTGKLPALLEFDLGEFTGRSATRANDHRLMHHVLDWSQNWHGIVAACCHWRAPMDEPSFYTKETSFDISRAVTKGTPEYAATLRDMDTIAGQLEVLRSAHVPVLWRPLHEANGRWFWWGVGGPEPFKKLWRMMFENFTVKHHLNNLIWVFSPGAETDLAAWYPGDAYVDIIGQDHYPMDGNHGSAKDVFDELSSMTRWQKLVALGENGPIPDPALMKKNKAGWLFFVTWTGSILFEETTAAQLRAYYNNPYVLTLEDLPDMKKFSAPPAGKAIKLGFVGAPGDVAVGGTRRMPVTVAVQDEHGETVRDGSYLVTLALAMRGDAKLSGTLSVSTVNGIATFLDVAIDSAIDSGRFIAIADGLQSATSQAFQVGPGTGLLHEWWLGRKDFRGPPAGSEIWSTALESPVRMSTNFSARTRGVLVPPQTGEYRFWIADAGTSELWLGTDSSPENMIKIGGVNASTPYRKWPHINEAESKTVKLTAGQRYSFEIRQWQDDGSTQLRVRWQLPDGQLESPVPALYFAPNKDKAKHSQHRPSMFKYSNLR